jgi:hypothetical protein
MIDNIHTSLWPSIMMITIFCAFCNTRVLCNTAWLFELLSRHEQAQCSQNKPLSQNHKTRASLSFSSALWLEAERRQGCRLW